jgi:hypothetical protein
VRFEVLAVVMRQVRNSCICDDLKRIYLGAWFVKKVKRNNSKGGVCAHKRRSISQTSTAAEEELLCLV